jgi:prepilin-type N-terminal cleavage/methylation domain-containing protein
MKRKGFTLVELAAVIAIVSILALIILPKFLGQKTGAKEEADKASAVCLANALDRALDDGTVFTYPVKSGDLKSSGYLNADFLVQSIKVSGAEFRLYLTAGNTIQVKIYNPADLTESIIFTLPRK